MDSHIDYLTIHIWPQNWGWCDKNRLSLHLPNVYQKTGSYHFTMKYTSAGETFAESAGSDNNSYANANKISFGKTYKGQLAVNDDVDYYVFSMSAGRKVTFAANCDVTVIYGVYDSGGSLLYTAVSKILKHDLTLAGGTYYIAVRKFSLDTKCGNYSISIDSTTEPASVVLSKTKLTMYKGTMATLTAAVRPAGAEPNVVYWSSSNAGVAFTLGSKVIAVAPGTARITAKTSNGKTAVCTVKVILYNPVVRTLVNTLSGVKLSWDTVNGAVRYRIFYHDGKHWLKLADTTSTSYVHKSVKSGKKYRYTVRCVSGNGKQFTSNYNTAGWSITYVAAPKPPTLKNTKNGVRVSWKRVTGASKYRVFRKTGNGEWIRLADTNKAYIDKTAKNGVTYRYTVRCLNKNGKYISAYTGGSAIKCKR